MSYVALYRRFRPASFDEVKGQDQVVKTLRHQVISDRLQHAYLFCGTRGSGKTSVAKILARAVNCENPQNGSPCGVCALCRAAAGGSSINVIEIDAASNNGVDNVREIVEEVQYRPVTGRYKVYIIDEVHMMSGSAFSALLKTLEEPPEYVIFILATTEPAKIPVTILSRCQRYDFRRIKSDVIFERLREICVLENIDTEDEALSFIAGAAGGSMRDALSMLDRCIAFCTDETLNLKRVLKALGEADYSVLGSLTEEILRGNAGGAVRILGRLIAGGMEIGQFAESYISYLERLLILSVLSEEQDSAADRGREAENAEMKRVASLTEPEILLHYIRVLSELAGRMRSASNRRVLAEVTLIQMANPRGDRSVDALPGRIRNLELALDESGGAVYAGRIEKKEEKSSGKEVPDEDSAVLPEAAPEDLKRICGEWKRMVASMPDGPLRTQLRADAVPQFNAETMENRLYVEFRSTRLSEQMNRVLVDHEDYREELERFLEKQTGRHVEVEFHLKENRAPGLMTVDIDRQLMELGIEFEEEDTEDF